MKKINFKQLVVSFSIVAILVLISMIFTKNSMALYENMVKPDIAPPAIVFPIVWTILYTIIAITLYRFNDNPDIKRWLLINLVINIIWPILFFRFELILLSAFWLMLIIISLIITLLKIYKEDQLFAYLNLPYLVWLFFALYLNLMIFFLNNA